MPLRLYILIAAVAFLAAIACLHQPTGCLP